MLFKVKGGSSVPKNKFSFTVEVPDDVASEYTTIVETGVAAVLAKASALLIHGYGGDQIKVLDAGLGISRDILSD
jgi:hypothetical protein